MFSGFTHDGVICIWTPPTAETFLCFISRTVQWLKTNSFVDSKRNSFLLFYFSFISVRRAP